MPPSCGYRDDSSMTHSPSGTAMVAKAAIQKVTATAPAAAAVATHCRLMHAVVRNITTSQNPSERRSFGWSSSCAIACPPAA